VMELPLGDQLLRSLQPPPLTYFCQRLVLTTALTSAHQLRAKTGAMGAGAAQQRLAASVTDKLGGCMR